MAPYARGLFNCEREASVDGRIGAVSGIWVLDGKPVVAVEGRCGSDVCGDVSVVEAGELVGAAVEEGCEAGVSGRFGAWEGCSVVWVSDTDDGGRRGATAAVVVDGMGCASTLDATFRIVAVQLALASCVPLSCLGRKRWWWLISS